MCIESQAFRQHEEKMRKFLDAHPEIEGYWEGS